jgi:hypothetical protein
MGYFRLSACFLVLSTLSTSNNGEFTFARIGSTAGALRLGIEGVALGERFEVQASTNLANWKAIVTARGTTNEITVVRDENAPIGYYRLYVPPADVPTTTFGIASQVQNSNGGALGTWSGNLDSDDHDEFVSIASLSSADPHFRIHDYSPQKGVWSRYDVISAAAVGALQDRFGTQVVVADIDGDGDNDIAAIDSSNRANGGKMYWYENPGTLKSGWESHTVTTWSGRSTDTSITHSEIAAGDINNDGHQDLVARDVRHGLYVLIQEPPFDGSKWASRKFIPTNPREGIALADIDKDKDLDIVINGVWFETPSDPVNGEYVRRTYGASWYPSGSSQAQIDDYACQVAVADFDRDGDLDVVVTNAEELANSSSTSGKPQGIRIYLCPADPRIDTWAEVILYTRHFSWHSCEVADFDLDGDLDVVSAISTVGVDSATPLMMLFKNDGAGLSFTPEAIERELEIFHYQMSAGDYDGDGDVDLFAPQNWNSGPIWTYQNQTVHAASIE